MIIYIIIILVILFILLYLKSYQLDKPFYQVHEIEPKLTVLEKNYNKTKQS